MNEHHEVVRRRRRDDDLPGLRWQDGRNGHLTQANGVRDVIHQRHDSDGNWRRRANRNDSWRHPAARHDHINDIADFNNDHQINHDSVRPMWNPCAKRAHILVPLLTATLLLTAPLAALDTGSATLLNRAWPNVASHNVTDIGRGVGVVFSPDLSVDDNCRFYQSLGFACFQGADWENILDDVHRYNVLYPDRRIFTLILETHGTNGNGLKLQTSYAPDAERSYIAAGALQQRLEPEGIYYVIISACNSGRLLRPSIYNQLDPNNGDKLFLPATKGIINASSDFIASRSAVMIITPESSHIETTLVGKLTELSAAARRAITVSSRALGITPPKEFAVSDMMVAMLTRDPHFQITSGTYVDELSRDTSTVDNSEQLFRKFVRYVNAVAARQYPPAAKKQVVAHKAPKKKSVTGR